MLSANPTTQAEELLSYVIASGDMRFIGIGERVLYLYQDPECGSVIRGEIPGCSAECHANLSQILLEYVMSCGDCRDAEFATQAADRFGTQLGQKFVDVHFKNTAVLPTTSHFIEAMTIIIKSLDVPFQLVKSENQLQFTLSYCPLHTNAEKTGLNLWVTFAHRAFITLIETIMQKLACEWTLDSPAERESSLPMHEIVFIYETDSQP